MRIQFFKFWAGNLSPYKPTFANQTYNAVANHRHELIIKNQGFCLIDSKVNPNGIERIIAIPEGLVIDSPNALAAISAMNRLE